MHINLITTTKPLQLFNVPQNSEKPLSNKLLKSMKHNQNIIQFRKVFSSHSCIQLSSFHFLTKNYSVGQNLSHENLNRPKQFAVVSKIEFITFYKIKRHK